MTKLLVHPLVSFITAITFIISIGYSTLLDASETDVNNINSTDHPAYKLITKDEFYSTVTPISLDLFQQLIIGMNYQSGYIDNNEHQLGVLSTDTNILTVRICSAPVVNNDGSITLEIACTGLSVGEANVKFLIDGKSIKEWAIQVVDPCFEE